MGQKAGTGPPPLGVERRFETNRLAADFQSQAYEQVVPAVSRSWTRRAAQAGEYQDKIQLVDQGGVAA
jgi:hypothetical protein